MENRTTTVNLFEYRDYRKFLKDWYEGAQNRRPRYSFRALAQRAGFKSSNFLMLVMQGKRNLTEESSAKVGRALGLNKQEGEFFRNLVFFNQAETHEAKNIHFKRLIQSKKFSLLKPIEKKNYEYYSSWYHPVVRELVVSGDFDGTSDWIANKIFPPITPAQAAKSIELLEKIGLIEKTPDNKWKQPQTLLTTGPELISVVVHNYHKALLELTMGVMDRLSMRHRDVSAMTLGIKRERLPQLREKIREFRREILKMVADDTEPDDVVQLNIQFFPVTKIPEGDKEKKGRTP